MFDNTLTELKKLLLNKDISSVELTQHFLDRADRFKEINAYITLCPEQALAEARAADQAIAAGNTGLLTGLPLAQKDIFCTKGVKTSCGSKMLDNFVPPYDATVIQQFKQAGAVTLGKTNMDEFAMGSSNETSFYGPVQNPWRLNTTPGGSSGGSAAAVAARLAPAATGTDTGGSIRQPASFSNLVGLKPTYGTVSRFGMIAFCSSMDQAGPMTQTAEDAALMLNAMIAHDPKDSTSVKVAKQDYTANLNKPLKGLKVGLPRQYFDHHLDKAIADKLDAAKKVLADQGAEFIEVDLPHSEYGVAAYYIVAPAEASANLARYDGVRFGYRCDAPKDLNDLYTRSRSEGFGEEVKRRIIIGTYVLSAGFYDAYYTKAQRVRRLIKQDFMQAFAEVDVILGPTAPSVAFELNSVKDPVQMYLNDVYTIPVNLAGLPAVSVPAGFIDDMPIGMQLIGNYFSESQLLNVAHQYQQATAWHKTLPAGIDGGEA